MAVQKSRVTRSKRGMRNSHNALSNSTLSVDVATGEIHRRHHISPEGYYKGRQVISSKTNTDETEEESAEE